MKIKILVLTALLVGLWSAGSSYSFASIDSIVPYVISQTVGGEKSDTKVRKIENQANLQANVNKFDELLFELAVSDKSKIEEIEKKIDYVFVEIYNEILHIEKDGELQSTEAVRLSLQQSVENYMMNKNSSRIPATGQIEIFSKLLTESLIKNS